MRGQITIYLILGIMVLAIVLFILFLGGFRTGDVVQRDTSEVADFAAGTLDLGMRKCLVVIGMQAGWYQPPSFLKSGAAKIGFAWRGNDTLIKINGLSEELVRCVEAHLNACLSFESFRSQGFAIENGEAAASVLLGATDVSGVLQMPLSVTLAEQQQRFDEFASERTPVRLAHLHSIASNITELRSSQEEPRDFDLSYLAAIDVNVTIYEVGSEQVYVLSDPQSKIQGEQYQFVFANSFAK